MVEEWNKKRGLTLFHSFRRSIIKREHGYYFFNIFETWATDCLADRMCSCSKVWPALSVSFRAMKDLICGEIRIVCERYSQRLRCANNNCGWMARRVVKCWPRDENCDTVRNWTVVGAKWRVPKFSELLLHMNNAIHPLGSAEWQNTVLDLMQGIG